MSLNFAPYFEIVYTFSGSYAYSQLLPSSFPKSTVRSCQLSHAMTVSFFYRRLTAIGIWLV
jgi:hypothetical protein